MFCIDTATKRSLRGWVVWVGSTEEHQLFAPRDKALRCMDRGRSLAIALRRRYWPREDERGPAAAMELRSTSPQSGRVQMGYVVCYTCLVLAGLRLVASRSEKAECALPGWPADALEAWPFRGARERCFCAYTSPEPSVLDSQCRTWREWVSTDRVSPDRLHQRPRATIIGGKRGNASASRYAYVGDWAVDLGSGHGADCERRLSPTCQAVGAHVLSTPRRCVPAVSPPCVTAV